MTIGMSSNYNSATVKKEASLFSQACCKQPPSLFCSFMTPLHVAAERAHNDILEVLQKHGAKVGWFVCFLFCKTRGNMIVTLSPSSLSDR